MFIDPGPLIPSNFRNFYLEGTTYTFGCINQNTLEQFDQTPQIFYNGKVISTAMVTFTPIRREHWGIYTCRVPNVPQLVLAHTVVIHCKYSC